MGRAEGEHGVTCVLAPTRKAQRAATPPAKSWWRRRRAKSPMASSCSSACGCRCWHFSWRKRTHAPRAVGLYENGLIRETPSPQLLYTMADPPNFRGATQCGQMLDVMAFLQQGRVQLGFLGAAEVDRFGNLNSTWGDRQSARCSGCPVPAARAISHASRNARLCCSSHERARFRERVGHITSPGNGSGNGWRDAQGLPLRSGPSALITTMGVLRFGSDGEAFLASVHPGVSVEEVLANTGWTLRVADKLEETRPPSDARAASNARRSIRIISGRNDRLRTERRTPIAMARKS